MRFVAVFPLTATLLVLTGPAYADGVTMAANSQQTYSFSCPSGANGQLTYARGSEPAGEDRVLVAMVNGAYLQKDPRLVQALAGKAIESISAGCQGDAAIIFFTTWRDGDAVESRKGIVTVRVDSAGTLVSINE